ncbi:MAG: TolC family protein [Vicinamibacteria bacterium]|nr:TolC family protein [Vicinamibacteria bacterium]
MHGIYLHRMAGVAVALTVCLGSAALDAQTAPAPELGVEDALAAALAAQPRLAAAESRLAAATARVREARLARLGELKASGIYTPEQRPLRIDFEGFPPLIPATSFDVKQLRTYALSASYSVPLWTGGALSSQIEAARGGERIQSAALAGAEQQIRLQAARAFYAAAVAAAGVIVAEANLGQQQAFLGTTSQRVSAGAAARLDQLKAELGVARAESDLSEARNRERLAREALVTVTDDARFRAARLKPLGDTPTAPNDESAALAKALRQRPDLLVLRHQVATARAAGDALQGARLPVVAVRADITQQNDAFDHIWKKDSQIYSLGLAFSWDPLKALLGGAAMSAERATERAVAHSLKAAEQEAALAVRQALLQAQEAQTRIRVQQDALAVAEEQARIARLAYSEGVITAVEAQDAELGLTSTRFAVLRARFDAATALAELKYAIGE